MRLVVLACDVVIDRAHDSAAEEDWAVIPGSPAAVARLNQAYFRVVVVANAPEADELDGGMPARIHARMMAEIAREGGRVEAVFYCPHERAEECTCRLPRTGLFDEIRDRLKLDLSGVTFIGRSRDYLAGARAAGVRVLAVAALPEAEADARSLDVLEIYPDLAAAVAALTREQEVS